MEQILAAIAADTQEGAAALAARGLDALDAFRSHLPADADRARAALFDLTRRIGALRPAMGAIGVQALLACDRARTLLSDGLAPGWGAALQRALREAREVSTRADPEIAASARTIIGRGRGIVTCSYSRTVLNALLTLEPAALHIGEGHPLGDGVRAARHLAAHGLDPTLVSDSALPSAVRGADAVVIGADQVLMDGSVVNRSSSFSMALAARHFDVPFIVLCQRIKVTGLDSSAVTLERCPGAFPDAPPNLQNDAPLFDITPAALVSKIVTEIGVLDRARIKALGGAAAALREEIMGTGDPRDVPR